MKNLLLYLYSKRYAFILFLIIALLVLLVFKLYNLPLQALIYPCILSVFIILVFTAVDFYSVNKKYNALHRFGKMKANMLKEFSKAQSLEEKGYQEIINSLLKEINALETETALSYQNMLEYFSVWAHQIKTPIAAMQLILQNEDSSVIRDLSSEVHHIEQYVEMVMAFLRLDSDSTDYLFRKQDLDPLIRQAVSKFASEFISRKIRLEYSAIEKQIITDEKWFSFILEQLLSNALKYTRSGSIKIFLSDPQTLCIQDSGIGIAPEDLPRVFERGYTGINGRLQKQASGLGLYLCKCISQDLALDLSIKSELDVGTSVFIDLGQYVSKIKYE